MRGLFQRWLCVLFLAGVRGSPFLALGPIRCAPCTPEKLRDCPAVAPGCAEVQRESGCGCCSVCALGKGEPCGVYTAHCGTGLRCTPKPEDPRPMHSLIHGEATCTEYTESQASQSPGDAEVNIEVALDGYGSMLCMLSEDKPTDPKDLVDAQESIKAKINAIRNKLVEHGPCHTELHRALDKIATTQFKLGDKFTTFYLPNCDKHGFYKSKQCETSLEGQEARCWCVSSWNGKRLPGTSDLLGQSDCQQEVAH